MRVFHSYKYVKAEGHPRAFADGRIKEHILIAEKAIGHFLDRKHPVHHHDGNKRNNQNNNLVVCQDSPYHNLLHMRTRALLESGDANSRWCYICQAWDRPENVIDVGAHTTAHRFCKQLRERAWYLTHREYCRVKNARRYWTRESLKLAIDCGGKK